MSDLAPFLEAAVRTTTPLLIASVGETVSERAGVINVGLEGCIIAGAYAAFVSATATPVTGYAAAILAGMSVGMLLALFAVVLRRDQIIVGTALTMLSLGITGTLFRARGDATALVVATESTAAIPLLSEIPIVGRALFAQPAIAYLAFGLVPATWWWLRRTHAGLSLRAVGDAPGAARAAGVRVELVQCSAILFGSALGGLAGGSLVLAQAGSFAEGMSAGRGFLAIAIVALGRWRPAGVAIASVVFGAAMALQFVVQALGWRVRYELVLMIPYVLTLIALGAFGRGSAPAMLGRARVD
ncbi:MAG TPA: ABC transporter permease [Gemmatimonadaceae bacterium]